MISYLYWFVVLCVTAFVVWGIGKYFKLKVGLWCGAIVLLMAWAMYYFNYEQYFVKNLGGVMTISEPEGEMHLQATWKDDNLWIETYDPVKNLCHFTEYSKGNMLQGRVTIKNCNPLLPKN